MSSIFEIADEYRALDTMLEEVGGDVTDPAVSEYIDNLFTDLDDQLETKVEGYCRLIKEAEARSKARKEEADRMMNRSRTDANMAKGLKQRLQLAFDVMGIKKVETDRFRVSVATNGGQQPLVIFDSMVPSEFMKTTTSTVPDKDSIRSMLESGKVVEFAELAERGRRLNIK